MIVLIDFDAQGANFRDATGRAHRLVLPDLLALAREGRDVKSRQRAPGFLRSRGDLVTCEACDAGWQLGFADGSAITVFAIDLADMMQPFAPAVAAQVWRGDDAAPAAHDYGAVMAGGAARLACLRQVLSHGFSRLTGVPALPGTVAAFLESFGPVRETNYGRLFDVVVRPDPANLADSALALPPHTDNPYRGTPPDLQALHALSAAPDGGETWLVDGLAVVDHLRAVAPEALALLASVPVRFAWQDATWRLSTCEPVIALAPDGALVRLRVNSRSFDRPVEPDPARRAAWWQAWELLETCLADPHFALGFTLAGGEMVLMDNARVLHGRKAFAGVPGERHLQGAYADIDGLRSEVLRMAETRADAVVEALGDLFLAPDLDGHYGEDLSIRDHMLQSAGLAAERGLGEGAVAAALLHDIGWSPQVGGAGISHELAAADHLAPIFGEAVAAPVRWHVAAKRYLVTRRPAYRDCLSQASLETLRQQGGPMDAAECAAFEAIPDHQTYVAIREIDDAGKAPIAPVQPWAEYTALLRKLALAHALAG